jgi:hypothetical protein
MNSYSSYDRFLVAELQSLECQVCGAPKESKRTFCKRCYWKLPAALRSALYLKLHGGYQEARDEAAAFLRARLERQKSRDGKL